MDCLSSAWNSSASSHGSSTHAAEVAGSVGCFAEVAGAFVFGVAGRSLFKWSNLGSPNCKHTDRTASESLAPVVAWIADLNVNGFGAIVHSGIKAKINQYVHASRHLAMRDSLYNTYPSGALMPLPQQKAKQALIVSAKPADTLGLTPSTFSTAGLNIFLFSLLVVAAKLRTKAR